MKKPYAMLVLLLSFIEVLIALNLLNIALSSQIIFTPISSVIETPSNGLFNLAFKMRFDEPEAGFLSITLFWDNNESDPNSPYWNFTFISISAKFVDGTEFSARFNMSIKKATPSGFPSQYYRYTIGISEIYGENKNGEFWVNMTMLAAGVSNGVYKPHAEGVQNFTVVNVRAFENSFSESGPGDFSVKVLPQTKFHDVAIASAALSKTIVGLGYSMGINLTVENQGDYGETFNITVFANATSVALQTVTLASGNSTTITFVWNTTGFSGGNYTISAVIDTVPGETDTRDNTLIDGLLVVTIPGDVDGNHEVDIFDAILLAGAFGSKPGSPYWKPNADINGDGSIDIFDAIILAGHFGETDA